MQREIEMKAVRQDTAVTAMVVVLVLGLAACGAGREYAGKTHVRTVVGEKEQDEYKAQHGRKEKN